MNHFSQEPLSQEPLHMEPLSHEPLHMKPLSHEPLSHQQQYNWWDRHLPCRSIKSPSPCTVIQKSRKSKKRKFIDHSNNSGSFQKKSTFTHLQNLKQLKCLTIHELLNPTTTYLYPNSSVTLDEVFFKKEIHNEIFDRLNRFIGDMIVNEGVNWNLLSQRY